MAILIYDKGNTMSASQALASARRRRVNAPSMSRNIRTTNPEVNDKTNVENTKIASVESEQNDNTASDTFVPKPVPEARNPTQLLKQHNVRLYNLENGISHSMSFIDSNIDILSTGYNNVATNLEKFERLTDASLSSVNRLIRDLTDRIAYLESKLGDKGKEETSTVPDNESDESVESPGSTVEGEEEVTIHFSSNNS